jgi:hypothetical protein
MPGAVSDEARSEPGAGDGGAGTTYEAASLEATPPAHGDGLAITDWASLAMNQRL